MAESVIIAEGRADSSYCVWNADHTLILTIHKISVFKYFKGSTTKKSIDVVTIGGELDGQLLTVEPELHLENGAIGILFLKQNVLPNTSVAGTYIPVASEQGFIEYDMVSKSAAGPYDKFSNVTTQLYPTLIQATGKNYSSIQAFNISTYLPPGIVIPVHILATPVITGFSPSPITAGTNSVLTINGSNFGASYTGTATVQFKNANDGGATYISVLAAHIVSWSDAQIQVKVPSQAGTGTIRVFNSTNETGTSGSNLTITYNQLNATSGGIPYEPNLLNVNGSGGYTYVYSTATANSGVSFDGHTNAKASFASALSTWRCNTAFNVVISAGNTAIGTAANDGTSVVMFDNAATPLPTGVLGRAYSWWQGCSPDWYAADIDIEFKRDGTDGVIWYFGAAGSQPGGTSDFETVALHELGHNHQLGHTISPGTVMHYAITIGTNNRSLNPAQDIAGGNYVMAHSSVFSVNCSGPKVGMTPFNCALPPVANFSGTPLTACSAPLSVNFTDLSSNAPTSWSWSFPGATPNTSTLQNPTNIVYNSPGTYNVTLTATNANGSDPEVKTGYITVGGSNIPLTETFEGSFPPTSFSIVNPDANVTWQQTANITGLSGAVTKAAYMDCYDYNMNVGTTDDITTYRYNLAGTTTPQLKFDLAYARYDAVNFERLQVLLSTDCSTFPNIIYDKSSSTLATVADNLNEFVPNAANQWRLETVSLAPYVGSTVTLKFRVTNGFGNNLYIDNINVLDGALPVVLESFNAVKSGAAVKLSWKTEAGSENEIYVIERSSNGNFFEEIHRVNASQGNNNYQAIDQTPGDPVIYYRLKTIDISGGISYSSIVSVDMSSSEAGSDLILFPNPVSAGEKFYFTNPGDGSGDLRALDLTGKELNDISFNTTDSFIEVTGDMKAGVYIIEYVSGGVARKGRILVK
ncbi:MAG: PKD domain-containing protein [Cytophagaceae bacterium]|nr:PKD domain-containing protein [Cytophagaceae bacterium]